MRFDTLLQFTAGPGTTAPAPTQVAPAPGTAPVAGSAPAATGVAGTGPSTMAAPSTLPAKPQPADPGIFGGMPMMLMMVGVFIIMYFFLFRGQRKDEKARKRQISEMKKGDEVLLISGKFGKVVDIREDRVVVKVDEANNVKETYLKSAIQRVMNGDDAGKK